MSENTRRQRQAFAAANWFTSGRAWLRSFAVVSPPGGARRDRTDDLLLAKQALSQLSYGPSSGTGSEVSDQKLVLTSDA